MPACPACGLELAGGPKFCPECGTKLEVEVGIPGESRRVVTILFSDVTGSTALGEQLDPEAVRALMGRYFSAMMASPMNFSTVPPWRSMTSCMAAK